MRIIAKIILIIVLVALSSSVFSQITLMNPNRYLTVLGINRLENSSLLIPFSSDSILSKSTSYLNSKTYQSLEGEWKYIKVYKNSVDTLQKVWSKINVPFTYLTPNINQSPQSIYYKREFTIDREGSNKVILHFSGVMSPFYVYVNNFLIGYSRVTSSSSEFDITPYIHGKNNKIVVKEIQGDLSDSRFGKRVFGIYRSVFIYQVPKNNLEDFSFISSISENKKNALIKINGAINTSKFTDLKKLKLTCILLDPFKKQIFRTPTILSNEESISFNLQKEIQDPYLWSYETPYLYTIIFKLSDGKRDSYYARKVGIREISIDGNKILLNRVPIEIKGVNKEEFSIKNRESESREDLLKDIELLKKNNFNAIRTIGGPRSELFYELCDQYGILVFNEISIPYLIRSNKHSAEMVANMKKDILETTKQIVLKDKNHPSVVAWSLGTFAEYNPVYKDLYSEIKKLDKQDRPICYGEQTEWDFKMNHYSIVNGFAWQKLQQKIYRKSNLFDILLVDYPPLYKVAKINDKENKTPILAGRYSRSEGNSNSNFNIFWDNIKGSESPRIQGGFVSSWIDNTIVYDTISGNYTRIYSNGLKNGSKGILFPDKNPKPAMSEIRYVQQNIDFNPIGIRQGVISVKNNFKFRTLDGMKLYWTFKKDGIKLKEGNYSFSNLEPRQSRYVLSNIKGTDFDPRYRYTLDYVIVDKTKSIIQDLVQDSIIAWKQFEIPVNEDISDVPSFKSVDYHTEDEDIVVEGDNFKIKFSKDLGVMINWIVDGKSIINQGPRVNFWRVSTSCNRDKLEHSKKILRIWDYKKWKRSDYKFNEFKKNILFVNRSSDTQIDIISHAILRFGLTQVISNIIYSIHGDGSIEVMNQIHSNHKSLWAKIGNTLQFEASNIDSIQWFGKGPWENYDDRNTSATIGIWKNSVDDMTTPYIQPQENGNRSNTYWVKVLDNTKNGIMIKGDQLNFSTHKYTLEDLSSVSNYSQLGKSKTLYVNIDYKLNVLNSDQEVFSKKDQTVLIGKKYEYKYTLIPIIRGSVYNNN